MLKEGGTDLSDLMGGVADVPDAEKPSRKVAKVSTSLRARFPMKDGHDVRVSLVQPEVLRL